MAILWQRCAQGRTYQVRGAGKTLRLYTDGVFHSQYNPNNPVTGSIWDLLLLPAFFYPKEKIKRILVLGVGGGAVIRQFQYFFEPEQITGVELNPNHLYVARNYFGVSSKNTKLHLADAVEWVQKNSSSRFDIIIDDLFGEENGNPVRAITADSRWLQTLGKMLVEDGALVSNFVSTKELKNCAYFSNRKVSSMFNTVFRLTAPGYENAIGVFLKKNTTPQILRSKLLATPELNPTLKTSRLKYSITKLQV